MADVIGELVKALQHFLTRDIMYLVGGASVGVTLLHVSGQSPTIDYPTAIWLWAAGAAYGIGYSVQELVSHTRILTTAPVLEPGRLVKRLYKNFTRTDWISIDQSQWQTKQRVFEERASERSYSQYQRIIGLKHVASTLGANWFVCGIILAVYAIYKDNFLYDWILALAVSLISVGLMAQGWVKGAQQVRYVFDWIEPNQADNSNEVSKQ